MAHEYDLVVIGTGSAAAAAAFRCREAGWKVAVVDHQPFGGTCSLRGCDPKRALMAAAEALDFARRMEGKGLSASGARIDWSRLMRHKRTFTEPAPHRAEQRFVRKGIDAYHGRARFTGPRTVVAGDEALAGRFVLIAAGAVPRPLGIDGEEHVVTSTDFLDLDRLPARIVLVGGGYIAAEFSHLAVRAGAHVTVVQRASRLLPAFDAEVVGWLVDRSRALGIDIRLDTAVQSVERTGRSLTVRGTCRGEPVSIDADLVVHAAGRVPDVGGLDLEAARIEHEQGRLAVNDFLQSVSNPAVYAAGDAASKGPALTPVASYDGGIAAANMLEGNRSRPDYAVVPSAVFTIPPLASVGASQAQAIERGLDVEVKSARAADWYTAARVGEEAYGYKTVVEKGSGRLLGATLLGPQADETINLFALAMRSGVPAKALKQALFAYPTAASDIRYML